MTGAHSLLDQPAFRDALADELAVAGLPFDLDELGRSGQDVVTAAELCVRGMMGLFLDPTRTQLERRVTTATLMACARYAGTCFGAGDAVTLDWWEPGEPDRPEGTVLSVAGRTSTVLWDNDNVEEMDAADLRHDHGLRWYPPPAHPSTTELPKRAE